jgi:predicted porin
MKKSLLALATLASMASAASAQNSVTIYGVLDAGMSYENTGKSLPVSVGEDKWSVQSGISQPSVLGFRGNEDLGGTLKMLFQLEAGIQIDNGVSTQTGTFFNRASWLGLSGDFGTVTVGRQLTPMYNALKSIDPFELGLAGAASNLMSVGGANIVNGAPVGGNDVAFGGGGIIGQNNSMRYTSQNDNGLSATFNYSFGEIPGSAPAGREMGATVNYENGPYTALVSYDGVNAVNNSHTFKTTLLGGVINWASFGFPLKTSLGYAINKGTDVVGGAEVDSTNLIVGFRLPLGPHEFLASYIHKNDKTAQALDANQSALGYTYAFSKRTSLYTSFAIINNKNGADYTIGNATNVGYGVKVFDVGMRHSF